MPKQNSPKNRNRSIPWWVWGLLLAGAAAVIAALALNGSSNPARTLPDEVSVQQAAELRDQGAFLLDVREPEEWAAGHIPGATLIPLGELQSRLAEVPRDQTVVVYCRSGNRSVAGRQILKDGGFTNVASMSGGIQAWVAAGYETAAGN